MTKQRQELKDYRLPGQVLCSLLIVAGHTLLGNNNGNNSEGMKYS